MKQKELQQLLNVVNETRGMGKLTIKLSGKKFKLEMHDNSFEYALRNAIMEECQKLDLRISTDKKRLMTKEDYTKETKQESIKQALARGELYAVYFSRDEIMINYDEIIRPITVKEKDKAINKAIYAVRSGNYKYAQVVDLRTGNVIFEKPKQK